MKLDLVYTPFEAELSGVKVLEACHDETWSFAAPLFSDDPDATGRKVPRRTPPIRQSSFVAQVGAPWTLNGHRWFFREDEAKFFADYVYSPDKKLPTLFATDRHASIAQGADGTFELLKRKVLPAHIEGPVGLAISAEPSNWGSFLFRVVPKLVKLKLLGIDRVLMFKMWPQQQELATLLGFGPETVVSQRLDMDYTFDAGVLVSQCHSNGFLNPFARAALQGVAAAFGRNSRFGRKIYVSRRGGMAANRPRSCLNEVEVESALHSRGFETVIPDMLTVAEQIAVFANADFVVGPAGAGLFNCVFCRPGTRLIDIESENTWIFAHTSLFSSLGLQYGVFWARAEQASGEHLPLTVNVEALLRRVDQMESVL